MTEFWNKFQVLEEVGIAQKVNRVCGASVGAITASLVAVGYTSEDLKEFMETDLRKVLVGKIRSHIADALIICYIKERQILCSHDPIVLYHCVTSSQYCILFCSSRLW